MCPLGCPSWAQNAGWPFYSNGQPRFVAVVRGGAEQFAGYALTIFCRPVFTLAVALRVSITSFACRTMKP